MAVKEIVVYKCSDPRCTGHLWESGGQMQNFEYKELEEKRLKIYKYDVPMPNEDGVSIALLPEWAEPLSVGLQDDKLVLWARVNGDSKMVPTHFIVTNTGRDYPHSMGRFLGSVTSSTGVVWHVLVHE